MDGTENAAASAEHMGQAGSSKWERKAAAVVAVRKGQRGSWEEDKAEVCDQCHDDIGRHKVDLLHEIVLALGVLCSGLGEQADADLWGSEC